MSEAVTYGNEFPCSNLSVEELPNSITLYILYTTNIYKLQNVSSIGISRNLKRNYSYADVCWISGHAHVQECLA